VICAVIYALAGAGMIAYTRDQGCEFAVLQAQRIEFRRAILV
jgi:hypothetical protein